MQLFLCVFSCPKLIRSVYEKPTTKLKREITEKPRRSGSSIRSSGKEEKKLKRNFDKKNWPMEKTNLTHNNSDVEQRGKAQKPITAIVCVSDVCVVYYEQIARINSI